MWMGGSQEAEDSKGIVVRLIYLARPVRSPENAGNDMYSEGPMTHGNTRDVQIRVIAPKTSYSRVVDLSSSYHPVKPVQSLSSKPVPQRVSLQDESMLHSVSQAAVPVCRTLELTEQS